MDTRDVSGMPEYIQLLQKQKQLLRDAKSRKGQRPKERYRETVILEFMFKTGFLMGRDRKANDSSEMHLSFVPPSYAPCVTPLRDLKKIMIEDLRLETHHRGTYILLRTVTPATKLTAVIAIVEDEDEERVISLQLYNQDKQRDAKNILEKGDALIVKEPYFKMGADGTYAIRVDHLGDIVHLSTGDERMPVFWEPRVIELDALIWKAKGNDYFKESNYTAAIDCYNRAFDCSPTTQETRSLALNRSLAFIKTKQFNHALSDAESAIAAETPESLEKPLFRKGQALYNLQRYRECCEVFKNLRMEYPSNQSAQHELTRAIDRLVEQEKGTYHFKKLHMEANKLRPPHLDHATYIGPVTLRETGSRGRGLFTTKEVKAGDLLLCEKAFAHAFVDTANKEYSAGMSLLLNTETDRMTVGAQADLLGMIVRKLYGNPPLDSAITELHHGTYKPVHVAEVDGKPIVDTFLIERIISLNVFGCPLSTLSHYWQEKPKGFMNGQPEKTERHSCGIWPTASLINHSCYSNARRTFIGDMMMVRATQDLAPDTEIMFWYFPPSMDDYDEHQKRLSNWNFKCGCAICKDHQSTKKGKKQGILFRRKSLRSDVRELLTSRRTVPTNKIEAILSKLADTYTQPAVDVPRLAIWDVQLSLAHRLVAEMQPIKAVEHALKTLETLGYIVEGGGFPRHSPDTPLVVKRWGLMMDSNFECWMVLAKAYSFVAADLAVQAREYAKVTYRICFGEDETFEETCAQLV